MNRSLVERTEIHKAWLVTVKGFEESYVVFGPSAGKVRYRVYCDVKDAWNRCAFSEITVRRHKQADEIRTLNEDQVLGVAYA